MRKMIIAVVGLTMALGAFADTWTDPETGIAWTYSVESGNARVVCASPVEGDISIPSKFDEWSVTSIGHSAFYGCKSLTSVSIPEGVTIIGEYAFTGCNTLTSVSLIEGVTNIGEYAFSGCNNLMSVSIPEGVVTIGKNAFGECKSLTSLTIPKSVTTIGDAAFRGCSGPLEFVVDIGNRDYKSENGFLLSENGLVLSAGTNVSGNVTIPSCAMSIEGFAFAMRSGLTSVSIPEGVTNIGEYAFWQCESLASLTIPKGVTSVGRYAFWGCPALHSVDFEGAPPEGLSNAGITTLATIRYNIAYEDEWQPVIEECGFTNATPYTPPKPDGGPYTEVVDGIEWTFMVTNGESVVKRVPRTISGDVTIPSELGGRTVVGIEASVFESCFDLRAITIPKSIKFIQESAFGDCQSLRDVTFLGADINLSYRSFEACHWNLIFHVPVDWSGRGKTLFGYTVERAGESDAADNVTLTVTNVVVQYVLNSIQPNIAVPISGDTGFVTVITEVKSSGAVSVPTAWSDNYPSFTTKFGTDFGKALAKKSGKKDGSGNDMFVWQDYVAGTDPTNPDDKFTASITLVDGVPVISYTPELTAEQQALRTYKTWGKKQLQDKGWDDLTNVDGDGKKAYNFFKVTVEMK